MAMPLRYPKTAQFRFSTELMDRADAVLRPGESRAELVRVAVEAIVAVRESEMYNKQETPE